MGEDAKFMKTGSIEVLTTEVQCEWARNFVQTQRSKGFGENQIRFLSKLELKSIEPNVSSEILGGLYFPDEGSVSCK